MPAAQSEVCEGRMHIEFLLEEPSAEAVLNAILPKILSDNISFELHVFKGKQDLLKKLPDRLQVYSKWIPNNWRIVVLIDEDRRDCHELKAKLEKTADDAGFVTKSSAGPNENFQVVNRLAIEELEAWFFGDVEAVHAAYSRIPRNLQSKAKYRDPDAIRGGTYEALERLLVRARYYTGKLPKVTVAQNIAQHMEPNRNRSKSFQVFLEGLKACVGEELLV